MSLNKNRHQIETEEILEGFLYSFRQLDTNATKVYEASANIYALIELLVAKGIIGIEELDQRKKAVEKRLRDAFNEAGIGVRVENPGVDKYSLEGEAKVDCENRRHLCRSACCALAFPLSVQDINEGIRWSLGKPFLNAKGSDGYCLHLNRQTSMCSIYEHRPAVCRQYDCRNDRRIWLDFEKMIINPELHGGESPSQAEETSGE